MFEAGRRCHSGEGEFIFRSSQGSQIHKAIEEAIMHQSVQDLLAEATSQPQEFACQPPLPDGKTPDKSKVKKPIKVNQDRPRPVVQRKHGQQIHKAIEEVLMHHSVPTPLHKEPVPLHPSPKPKTHRPKDRPKVNNPAVSLDQRKSPPVPAPPPRVTVPRRNISSPDLVTITSSPSSPDDVLYTSILLEPKLRSRMNLPRVPTPPSLVHIKDNPDVSMDSIQEPSGDESEDNPYMNWMGKTTAEQDKPAAEVVYSTLNFTAKSKKYQSGHTGAPQQPNIDRESRVQGFISTEIPVDFKQTLSKILFKDLSKISPSFLPRSHGGSSDHLERTDGEMMD